MSHDDDGPFGSRIQTALAKRSKEFVFVIGCARSGTTVLFNYLSEIDDVFLFNEDNAFFPENGPNFAATYNEQWRSANKLRTKGYYVPDFCANDDYWFDVYLKLKSAYAVVGSKLAFGPHGDGYWRKVDDLGLSFFQKYFTGATYLLPVRSPAESILSMKRLFGGMAFGTYKNAWLKSVQFQLLCIGALPKTRFVFHDAINQKTFEEIATSLKVSPPGKSGSFIVPQKSRPSFIDNDDYSEITYDEGHLYELQQLERAYAYMRLDFDVETGRPNPSVHLSESVRQLWEEMEKIRSSPLAAFELG